MSRHYYLTTQKPETTFSYWVAMTMLVRIAAIIEIHSLSIALSSVSTVSVRSVCIRVLYMYPICHACLMGSLIASLMDQVPDGYILERLLDGSWVDGSSAWWLLTWWLLTWWQLDWWLYCLMTADLMAAWLMTLLLDGCILERLFDVCWLDGSSAWWQLAW